MNKKELRVVNFFLAAIVAVFGVMTVNASINENLMALAKDTLVQKTAPKPAVLAETVQKTCSNKPPLKLPETTDSQLVQLKHYQEVCGSFATGQMMSFTSFPASIKTAETDAAAMAQKLNNFQAAGVTPIIIVEPYVGDQLMNYKKFLAGTYDKAVDNYFKRLKVAGVTDQMMGVWVPFPESNTPNWDNKDTEPRDFALAVDRYLTPLHKYFPTAKASILLSATTYAPTDTEWENGDYLSLIPYLQDIDKSLISSIGIQGFPWVSRATQTRREIFRASEFLQTDLVFEAARELHTRNIWFNTGTFAAKYTNDPKQQVTVQASDRKAILSGILEEAKKIQTYQQNEYRVSLNLFAEDKSHANEATDWSYFQNNDNKALLREFLNGASEANIPVSLFDQAH